ncbi:MAG: nitrile hydratase subunit beta [Porticoccaceae bacterium]|nr:nitrile hydratase subunit beta [Porticoccaceae bacterium]
MDGIHDLGGVDGFGAIKVERNEPVFHEDWEPLGYALGFLGMGLNWWTADQIRHAIERMEPRHYLSASYYERYLTGVASLYVEKGTVSQQQLEDLAGGRYPLALPATPGAQARTQEISYAVGETVLVTNTHFKGHCRMPRYVRGKQGIITHIAPPFPFAGSAGHGLEAKLEPTYHVRFQAKDLWSDAEENSSVVVDLWQSYLEKAP